ncbi:MAG TPA: hypothetical protein PKY31_02235 [Spirochaetota bacterium]|nr:hypothetical protein [Spirochaetota bacterium]
MNRVLSCIALAAVVAGCSGAAVRNDGTEIGKVQRREEVKDGKHRYVEVASFIKGTNDPLEVKYYKQNGGREVLCREKRFFYGEGIVRKVDYYIHLGSRKAKTGRVVYHTRDFKPEKFEYFSVIGINNRKLNLTGLDMYVYAEGDGLESRRIIEYAYDPKAGTRMQLSQYVIRYENDRPVSMKSWLLDRNSNNLIVKDEDNAAVIDQMIKNIEKSLQERSQGIKYLGDECL